MTTTLQFLTTLGSLIVILVILIALGMMFKAFIMYIAAQHEKHKHARFLRKLNK